MEITGHNPYFNRWFSAMIILDLYLLSKISHNPYFNRWFSAINIKVQLFVYVARHNPYFNRWFSAICQYFTLVKTTNKSQSLF